MTQTKEVRGRSKKQTPDIAQFLRRERSDGSQWLRASDANLEGEKSRKRFREGVKVKDNEARAFGV